MIENGSLKKMGRPHPGIKANTRKTEFFLKIASKSTSKIFQDADRPFSGFSLSIPAVEGFGMRR